MCAPSRISPPLAALEPARERDLDLALERPAEEGRRGLARAADDDVRRRPGGANSVVGEHGDRPLLHDRELLGRDLLARLAEHVRVLEADVREQDDAAAEDVRRVEPAAEPRLDDGDVDAARGELGERRGAQRLELGRALRLRLRADARERRLEVGRLAVDRIRSLQPRTCGETVAPTESPSASSSASIVRVAVDLPFVPTTWIAG